MNGDPVLAPRPFVRSCLHGFSGPSGYQLHSFLDNGRIQILFSPVDVNTIKVSHSHSYLNEYSGKTGHTFVVNSLFCTTTNNISRNMIGVLFFSIDFNKPKNDPCRFKNVFLEVGHLSEC